MRVYISMNTKVCPSCNEEKSTTDFYKKKDRKNGSSICRKCFNEYCMERWKRRKIEAINYKGGSCIDCGIDYPTFPSVIFDFHHLEPDEKDFDWNRLRLRAWECVIKELDKCVLLCSNCHRIRHFKEQNSATQEGIEPPLIRYGATD